MNRSTVIASFLKVGFVLSLVIFRMVWAASSVAAAAGLGRLAKLPKTWRRWLFDEPNGIAD
jgi:hypothetical protein